MSAVAHTLLAHCPVCGSDAGEPEGVTGSMDDARIAVVVMRCGACSLVYLSPDRNTLGGSAPLLPSSGLSRRQIARWTRGMPASARILVAGCGGSHYVQALSRYGRPEWVLEAVDPDGDASAPHAAGSCTLMQGSLMDIAPDGAAYELLVLAYSLESASEPDVLLRHAKSLLSPGGRLIATMSNPDSSCFQVFGGRHWSGYRYPATRQLFSKDALRRLCSNAGLGVPEIYTLFASDAWPSSMANWLRDWGASKAVVSAVAGRWFLPRALAAALEGVAAMRRRGSLLVAELEKA